VTATFLNPAYRDILTDTQTGAAKDYLLGLCKPPIEDSDCTYLPEELAADDNSNNEPPSKHPKLLSRVALLLEEKRKEKQRASCLDMPAEQKEIQKYSEERFNEDTNDDPLNFWKDAANYPIIGPIACAVCVSIYSSSRKSFFYKWGVNLRETQQAHRLQSRERSFVKEQAIFINFNFNMRSCINTILLLQQIKMATKPIQLEMVPKMFFPHL